MEEEDYRKQQKYAWGAEMVDRRTGCKRDGHGRERNLIRGDAHSRKVVGDWAQKILKPSFQAVDARHGANFMVLATDD
jgi:hypothetical protein